MTSLRPDNWDCINAYRAGYRHGADVGAVSPRDAEVALRQLPTTMPVTSDTVAYFCDGSNDGACGDVWRYLLSFAVAP